MAKDKEIKVNVEDLEDTNDKPRQESSADDVAADAAGVGKQEGSEGDDGADTEPRDAAEPTAEEKLAELEDKLLRTMAEFDNYRKRSIQQIDQVRREANDNLLRDILEVVDNFERALQHSNGDTDPDALRKGTELIYNQLRGVLSRHNVKAIESLGKPFDPNLHDAMMQTSSEEHDEGMVAIEISRGYKAGDRVLRHAKVAVSTGPPDERPVEDESEQDNG